MENLLKKLTELRLRFQKMKTLLNIDEQVLREQTLRQQMSAPEFWNKREEAVRIGQEAEGLTKLIRDWQILEQGIDETMEIITLAQEDNLTGDSSIYLDLEKKYLELEAKFSHLEFFSLFSEKYDQSSALLAIHAGTGGVDAQDWAQMLERMYLRFAESQDWSVEILDRNYGNEAGIKSVFLRVVGSWAYGYLKSENGVHRLLRISPFDAEGLRHTSFALVEVIPEIKEAEAVIIKNEDLRIDVYRSSGPGGQSVNTTDSAVRLVHLPTGLTVTCQSERSQHQNKENALKILRAKLYQQALKDREVEEQQLRGEVQRAEWGKQIRSYFMYGNRLVKDHRTSYETADIESVLNGKIEPFIEAYLKWRKKE